MNYEPDFTTLLGLFIQLVQSQAGKRIVAEEEWKNDAQVIETKRFGHLASMKMVSNGTTIEHNGTPSVYFVDHASVKVLARAALETYLVFYYIYSCENEALSAFSRTWRLGAAIPQSRTRLN